MSFTHLLTNRQENQPQAVFICNSPLHVYNAIQAASCWGLSTEQCMLVLKVVNEKIQLPPMLEEQVRWKEVLRIDPFPVPPRLKAKGFKKRIIQYRFFRDWQSRLQNAVGCRYVFLCHNRQDDNKVIASYLRARELIWLEDGTLSYFLWQEERLLAPEVRAKRAAKAAQASKKTTAATKAQASKKTTAATKAQASKKTTAATKAAQASRKTTAATKAAQASRKTTAVTKAAKSRAAKGSSVAASKKGQKTVAARKKTGQSAIIKSKTKTIARRSVPAHTNGGKAK